MSWVGAGVAVGGAILGQMGASKAAKAQDKQSKRAIKEQRRQFDLTRADNKPWMDRGNEAGGALQQRMGLGADNGSGNYGELMHSFNNNDFVKDPGYQFRMDEGAKGVEHSAAARGGLLSGAQAKAMERYSQGFASNEFGDAYNRFNNDQGNRYNRLSGISQQGQAGAEYLGNAGQRSADAISGIQMQRGQNKAEATMGKYNALSQGLGGAYGSYTGGLDRDAYNARTKAMEASTPQFGQQYGGPGQQYGGYGSGQGMFPQSTGSTWMNGRY